MVHADQRQPAARRQPLGQHDARQHAADQPRPGGHRDPVQIGQPQPGLRQRLFDAGIQLLGMGAGGDFGHDAAEIGMQRVCPATTEARIVPSSRTTAAAAVSSQLLSMPRKVMRATLRVCAISDAVVEALPTDLRAAAVVAGHPDGPAMQSAIHCVISSLSP
jgi:hypothetical protein